MRIDRHGRLLAQTSMWVLVDLLTLVRADRLNLTEFLENALMDYYGLKPVADEHQDRIVAAGRDGVTRQRKSIQEREAGRERVRSALQTMRADIDAAQARQDGIAEALLQVAGDDPPARLARLLPENDPNGDRVDDWEALVRRVSRLCGAEIDTAEVADRLRYLAAAAKA